MSTPRAHGGALHAGALPDLRQGVDGLDQILQRRLGVEVEGTAGGDVALQVDPQGGPLGAGAREPQHHPAAVVEQHPQALARADRTVHRVGVAEIVGGADRAAGEPLARQGGEHPGDPVVEAVGGVAGHGFVIVAGVVVAAEAAPVARHHLCHRAAAHRQDLQPEEHRPEAVLLADVVAAGAEALLTAEGDAAGIEQVAEELPARGCLEAGDAQGVGHHVGRGAGGHGAGHAGQAFRVAGGQGGVGGEHGQAVAGIHEAAAPQDHVAVAIAVAGGAEVEGVAGQQQVGELVGIGEVGVGVAAAEVLQRQAVAHRAGRGPQQPLEQAGGVGAGDRVHGIEGDAEVAPQQGCDAVEVEQLLHQGDVVVDPVDHLHGHGAEAGRPGGVQMERIGIEDAIALQAEGDGMDGIGDRFRRRPAVGSVDLDAEVAVEAAGVVAGREDDPGHGAVAADQMGGGRGGEDAAGGGDQPADAMGRGHAGDDGDRPQVAVAAVTADHQGAAGDAGHHPQRRLDEALQVVGGLELPGALAQAGGAGLLVVEGSLQRHLTQRGRHRHGRRPWVGEPQATSGDSGGPAVCSTRDVDGDAGRSR